MFVAELIDKSFQFAKKIIVLSNYIGNEKKDFVLINRLLNCGTDVGLYIRQSYANGGKEGEQALQIALIRVEETEYLLELLIETGYLLEKQCEQIINDCESLIEAILRKLDRSQKSRKSVKFKF